jgi:hypothetical protein
MGIYFDRRFTVPYGALSERGAWGRGDRGAASNHRGRIDRLPDPLAALVVRSDLQGRAHTEREGDPALLLGETLANELAVLAELGELTDLARVGVVLAGDVYSEPRLEKRGGFGGARPAWLALRQRFRWVAGVAGNHDDFGSASEIEVFQPWMSPRYHTSLHNTRTESCCVEA